MVKIPGKTMEENKIQEQPDNDWIAYIPNHAWQAMQTLCDRMEQAKEEFQKAIDGMSSIYALLILPRFWIMQNYSAQVG